MSIPTVLGWPADEEKRKELELILGMGPLPRYEDSTEMDCYGCQIRILIGPRGTPMVKARLAVPLCIECLANNQSAIEAVVSLGNPNDIAKEK